MGEALRRTTASLNMRAYQRSLVRTKVDVNGGEPFRGGTLHDFSYGGAAVIYSEDVDTSNNPLEIGQTLTLIMDGKVNFPARIVRIFERGFATQFDFSVA